MRINIKNKYVHFLLLQLIFLGLAIIAFLPVFIEARGLWSTDNIFHWARINELAQCFKHGTFPQFDDYMSYRGIADATFYPWLTFVPFALLDMIGLPPIAIMDITVSVITVISYDVAYYSYYAYQHSRYNSFVFTLLYNFTVLFTSFYEPQGEIAELLSLAFVPMAFFGWLKIMHGEPSKMLIWGLAVMMYTHLVSVTILCILFILMTPFLMNWQKWKLTSKRLFKSGTYFLALTCAVWLPIIILMMTNDIQSPQLRGHMKKYAVAIPTTFHQFLLANGVLWCVMEIVAVVLGLLCWKRLTYQNKVFYSSAILALGLNIHWHFWDFLERTPIGHIQYPFRLMFVSHFLLAFILTQIIMAGFVHEDQVKRAIRAVSLVFILGASYFWIAYKDEVPTAMMNDTRFNLDNPIGSPSKAKMKKYGVRRYSKIHGLISYAAPKLTNYDMRSPKLLNTPMNMDYSRVNALHYLTSKASNRQASHYVKGKPIGQGIQLKSKKTIRRGLAPIMTYRTQRYYFYLNGRLVKPLEYRHDQPVFKSFPKGQDTITYRTPIMWYRWLAMIISISALACFGYNMYESKKKKQ